MSRKYKFLEPTGLHYVTCTTAGWVDIFTRQIYRDILIDSLKWCQQHKGLHICAYVIMSNHLHMVAYTDKEPLADVIGAFKRHTAKEILRAIAHHPESRREWLLNLLGWFGRLIGQQHQVWQHDNHPIALWSQKVTGQKIDYLHLNPVRAGYVYSAEQCRCVCGIAVCAVAGSGSDRCLGSGVMAFIWTYTGHSPGEGGYGAQPRTSACPAPAGYSNTSSMK